MSERAVEFDLQRLIGNVPSCLRERAQWVCWRYIQRDGKPTKCPISPTKGGNASSTDPATWGRFEEALAAVRRCTDLEGVGFVLSAADPFAGVDLDCCIDHAGEFKPWAKPIVDQLESYAEISPSGRGVKVFIRASKSGQRCKARSEDGTIELYDSGRFFTVTGLRLEAAPPTVEERQSQLDQLYERLFGGSQARASDDDGSEAFQPCPNPRAPKHDDEVIRILEHSKHGEHFKRLWQGQWRSDEGRYPSQNEADLALVSHLAFIVGADPERIDRLFRRSGLSRAKWERRDYRERTIKKALSGKTEFYRPGVDSDISWRTFWPAEEEAVASSFNNASGVRQFETDASSTPPCDGDMADRDSAQFPIERANAGHPYPRTDLGNAERLAAVGAEHVRYAAGIGWLAWDGRRWRADDTGDVVRLGARCVRDILREATACAEVAANVTDEIAKAKYTANAERLIKWARTSESRNRITSMIEIARSHADIAIRAADLDSDPFIFNCLNGTLDLRAGQLRPYRRTDLITRLAPVSFDSAAACPLWHVFLNRIFAADVALIRFVQRFLGMSLTADVREQILPIFYGQGNNGKNVLLDTVCGLMGDYASEAPPDLLTVRKQHEHPTEIADLCNRRLVVASESEESATLRLQLVKRLTGNARLKGRFMRQDYFEFVRTHKMILVTNNRPVIRENTEAAWRRIRLVPFNVVIPPDERDPQLLQKLVAEWPGIFAWLVRGCQDWLERGLGEPTAVTEATSGYRSEQDVFSEFIDECCVLADGAWVSRAVIYHTYSEWTQKAGAKRPPDRVALFERLRRIEGVKEAYGLEQGKRTRGFRGIGVQSSAVNDHAEGV